MTGRTARFIFLAFYCLLTTGCGEPVKRAGSTAADPQSLRLVTLSPQLAELVFAVGAGEQLVGVSAYTDYPPPAASLPVVGDAFNIDLERLALLDPDVLLAWDTGTPASVIDELGKRGYRVISVTTTSLADIAGALELLGSLTGRGDEAAAAAAAFQAQWNELSTAYAGAPRIRVFYQVDVRPLYTINGDHFVSELIDLCGGENIFSGLDGLAPMVSVEAVLERDPEVLLAASDAGEAAFSHWDRWTGLAANRYGNRFLMPADEIGRASPRVMNAATALCMALDTGRRNRDEND